MNNIQTASQEKYSSAKEALGIAAKNNNQYDLDSYKNKWGGTSTVASNVGAYLINDGRYIIGSYHEGAPYTSAEARRAMHDGTAEIIKAIENSANNTDGQQPSSPQNAATTAKSSEGLPLREKIGQMMFVGATNNKQQMVDVIKKYKIGGVMLTNESTSLYNKEAIDDMKDAAGGTLFIASDEEGGSVQRVGKLLKKGGYPSAKSLGGESEAEIENIAKDYGSKLSEIGINVNYAPVADLDDGSNSIISGNSRAFSSNPQTVANKAGAFAKGMEEAGVTPVFKHFPGHGHADGDSHKESVRTPSLSALKRNDLKPYETLLKNSGGGVMMGHLIVPGLTSADKNKQTSINKSAYDLLRKDYGFKGVAFTDEIANMLAITRQYAPDEAVALAIRAGADMPLFNYNSRYTSLDQQVSKTIGKVEQYVKANKIKNSDIDASLDRIASLGGHRIKTNEAKVSSGCLCGDGSISLTGSTPAAKAFYYFIGNPANLSPEASAGIVGNLMRESAGDSENLNPRAHNPSPFDGIAQWDAGRWGELKKYAAKKSRNPFSLELQLEFIWHELKTNPANGLANLKAASSAGEAAKIFDYEYERSNRAHTTQRMANAVKIFENYGGSSGGGSSGTSAESTSGENCESGGGSGVSNGNFVWPAAKQFPVTDCWAASRNGGRKHGGLDLGTPIGTKIAAMDGGVVDFAGTASGFGNIVTIKHDNGFWTLYAHLDSISVKKGDKVDQNKEVGKSGNTGVGSGPHLHFQIQKIPELLSDAHKTENPLNHLPADGRTLGGCSKGGLI